MKVPALLRGQRGLEAARKGSLSQFTQSTWEREVPGCSPRPRTPEAHPFRHFTCSSQSQLPALTLASPLGELSWFTLPSPREIKPE